MPKVVVSLEGAVVKEIPLLRDRTTLGRRPYNDIVIDNLAVSGEHAAFTRIGDELWLEDLASTNGSYVNGRPIKKQRLLGGETIEIGKYRIKVLQDLPGVHPPEAGSAVGDASIRILSGPAAGREMPITKAVTTIGKTGQVIATITRGLGGYTIAHVEGDGHFVVNGAVVGAESVALRRGDVLELGTMKMQFVQ